MSYYVTTPIYYVNDSPHIGHAYTSVASDVLARFMRLDGHDVKFVTGTDEHGQKVERAAAAANLPPQVFVNLMSERFLNLGVLMGLSNDDFIRTTEQRHKAACQELWRILEERDEIYLGTYEGWYSTRDEAFWAEDELTLQLDGTRTAPTGAPVERISEPSYFFRLSAWGERLLAFYDANPDFIAPASCHNEVVSFVSGGLRDLSVSRTSFRWGIPVPGDPDHVMYVWFDALTNYLTAAGYLESDEEFASCWPADLHMVGKDILRFHTVYWPAFLMAAGIEPPKRVFAHGWWTNEGKKISKSLGNAIDPISLVETYGIDQVRYFLMREVPFGNDGDFSHRAVVGRINGELVNDLGNLLHRSLVMIHKECGSEIPSPGALSPADDQLLGAADTLLASLREAFGRQQFHEGLEAFWRVVRAANVYVDRQAPWSLRVSDKERMGTILHTLAETLRRMGILLQPVMPGAAARLLDQLGVPASSRSFADIKSALEPGVRLPAPEPLFTRYLG